MDLIESLDKATQRIIQLEKELGVWQNKALDQMPPEALVNKIYQQQIETLTFHIMRSKQTIDGLRAKNHEEDEEIQKALVEIQNLHKELELKAQIIEKLKKLAQLKRETAQTSASVAPQAPVAQSAPVVAAPAAPVVQKPVQKVFPQKQKREKTIRDLIEMMSRLEHVQFLDAAILLEVSPETIEKWAKTLVSKRLIVVQGHSRQKKTLYATERLKKIK